jgi:hypothetical protein
MRNEKQPLWKRGMIVYTGPAPQTPGLNTAVINHVYKKDPHYPTSIWIRLRFSPRRAWMETNSLNVVWTGKIRAQSRPHQKERKQP